MSNMSYCRFQNTDGDLADCQGALEELMAGADADDEIGPLSDDELRAAKRLVKRCFDIVNLVAEYSGFDIDVEEAEENVDDSLEQMNKDAAPKESLEDLSILLREFCHREKLELASADEMLHNPDLTPDQKKWLEEFIEMWDKAA